MSEINDKVREQQEAEAKGLPLYETRLALLSLCKILEARKKASGITEDEDYKLQLARNILSKHFNIVDVMRGEMIKSDMVDCLKRLGFGSRSALKDPKLKADEIIQKFQGEMPNPNMTLTDAKKCAAIAVDFIQSAMCDFDTYIFFDGVKEAIAVH